MRILTLIFFLWATAGMAGPSFDCSVRLTDIEKQICDDRLLSDLDRVMARQYRALMQSLPRSDQRLLYVEQAAWRAWRDICPRKKNCLRQRYEARIQDFANVWAGRGNALAANTASCNQSDAFVVERRLNGNRFEVVYSDGRIVWTSTNGGSSGTVFPDGQETVIMKSQVTGADFPGLPGPYEGWGTALEQQLQIMVESLLPEADRAGYRELMAGKLYSKRVLDHTQALNFLIKQ